MAIFKTTVFILFYFFARAAFSACEDYNRGTGKESICVDEKYQAMISEKCLKSECDAKKFLSQYKANKTKNKTTAAQVLDASLACRELQLSVVILKDSKNQEVPFCLFTDASVLDAAVVQRLVL